GTVVEKLRRRAVLLGWNDHARALATEIGRDPAHPFRLVGFVALHRDTAAPLPPAVPAEGASGLRPLGAASDLESILAQAAVDVVILTRLDLPRADLQQIVETCER